MGLHVVGSHPAYQLLSFLAARGMSHPRHTAVTRAHRFGFHFRPLPRYARTPYLKTELKS